MENFHLLVDENFSSTFEIQSELSLNPGPGLGISKSDVSSTYDVVGTDTDT